MVHRRIKITNSIKRLSALEKENNAAYTNSFVPLLTLGIPGSGSKAVLLGNIVLLILNLPLILYIAKIIAVPRNYLIPFILFFSLMGASIAQNNTTEFIFIILFGVLAVIFRFANFPLPLLVLGLKWNNER